MATTTPAPPAPPSSRRWAVCFQATRGDRTATVTMGAYGDTWADACQFVRTHCAGQYDSISDITDIDPESTPAAQP